MRDNRMNLTELTILLTEVMGLQNDAARLTLVPAVRWPSKKKNQLQNCLC